MAELREVQGNLLNTIRDQKVALDAATAQVAEGRGRADDATARQRRRWSTWSTSATWRSDRRGR